MLVTMLNATVVLDKTLAMIGERNETCGPLTLLNQVSRYSMTYDMLVENHWIVRARLVQGDIRKP
jgi:hypothetical protein